jgi:hypothetical protein
MLLICYVEEVEVLLLGLLESHHGVHRTLLGIVLSVPLSQQGHQGVDVGEGVRAWLTPASYSWHSRSSQSLRWTSQESLYVTQPIAFSAECRGAEFQRHGRQLGVEGTCLAFKLVRVLNTAVDLDGLTRVRVQVDRRMAGVRIVRSCSSFPATLRTADMTTIRERQ